MKKRKTEVEKKIKKVRMKTGKLQKEQGTNNGRVKDKRQGGYGKKRDK